MKKKLIALLGLFAIMLLPHLAYTIGPSNRQKPDGWGLTRVEAGIATHTIRVDFDGNILPGRNDFSDIGESTHQYRNAYVGSLSVSSGIQNVHEYFSDVPAASSNAVTSGNGLTITSTTLVDSGTTYITRDLTQMVVPRNLVVRASFTTPSGTTTTLRGMATFYGINNLGINATEPIVFSTADTFGSVAWASISSVTIEITSVTAGTFDPANVLVVFGSSDAIGLANVVESTGDIYKLVEAGADNVVDSSVIYDSTNYTIIFETAPDGSNDYSVWAINRKTRGN